MADVHFEILAVVGLEDVSVKTYFRTQESVSFLASVEASLLQSFLCTQFNTSYFLPLIFCKIYVLSAAQTTSSSLSRVASTSLTILNFIAISDFFAFALLWTKSLISLQVSLNSLNSFYLLIPRSMQLHVIILVVSSESKVISCILNEFSFCSYSLMSLQVLIRFSIKCWVSLIELFIFLFIITY